MDNELVEEVVLQVPGDVLSLNGKYGGISGGKWWLAVTGVVGTVVVVGGGSSSTVSTISMRCVEIRDLVSASNSSNSVNVFCLRRSPLLWRDGIIGLRSRWRPWCWAEPGLLVRVSCEVVSGEFIIIFERILILPFGFNTLIILY